MNAIVAISENWGIGCENSMLFHISADLKRFRSLTIGKTVVMGHHMLLSMPGGMPLPERDNIIISSNQELKIGEASVMSITEFLQWLETHNSEDVLLIGGASLYAQLLSRCRKVFLTKVYNTSVEPDCFFPNLDKMENWKIESVSDIMEENGIHFQYLDYINASPI